MIVQSIKWISKSADDAEVTLTDGIFVCIAFSQPCNVNIGDKVLDALHPFNVSQLMLTDKKEIGIWPTNNSGLERNVVARLVESSRQLFSVGEIYLVVEEYLPGGIEEGDLVEFKCSRIDLW